MHKLMFVSTVNEPSGLVQFSGVLLTINKTLRVLTGLLAAALVVATMGWIVSCVYLKRIVKQR